MSLPSNVNMNLVLASSEPKNVKMFHVILGVPITPYLEVQDT